MDDWIDMYDEFKSEDSGEVREMEGHWLGKIMWEPKKTPFSAPGDSGALVYALEKVTVIPWQPFLCGLSTGSASASRPFAPTAKMAGYDRLRFGWRGGISDRVGHKRPVRVRRKKS